MMHHKKLISLSASKQVQIFLILIENIYLEKNESCHNQVFFFFGQRFDTLIKNPVALLKFGTKTQFISDQNKKLAAEGPQLHWLDHFWKHSKSLQRNRWWKKFGSTKLCHYNSNHQTLHDTKHRQLNVSISWIFHAHF